MTVIKLILITLILYFSSKSLGIILFDYFKREEKESLGVGYLANLALFFLLQFPVMLLKLSSTVMMEMGVIYLIVIAYSGYRAWKLKKLFQFSKKEIAALILTALFVVLYGFTIDFGYLETYDTYFYSVLTNGASSTKQISVFDPYTGLSNLQNYYKYISYYYQASFFSNLFDISHPYLVLIWPLAIMNYMMLFTTAFTVCRISKHKYVNHLISLFVITVLFTMYRAPFNAVHLVTLIFPVYAFQYTLEAIQGKKGSLSFIVITVLAAIAATSTTLFVMLPLIYCVFIAHTFYRQDANYKTLFLIAIPVIILGFLYLYESTDTIYALIMCGSILLLLWLLIRTKWFHTFLYYFGKVLFVTVPLLMLLIPSLPIEQFLKTGFMKSDAISAEETLSSSDIPSCIGENTLTIKQDQLNQFDSKKHSTSMEYIHAKRTSTMSSILIIVTHSIEKYGGLLFLLIFGLCCLRKDPIFLTFFVYVVTFYNPLVARGVEIITFGMGYRITLFFQLFFAIYGIKYFFEWAIALAEKKQWRLFTDRVFKVGLLTYVILFMASTFFYIKMFKKTNWQEYNILYKVPTSLIGQDEILNQELKKGQQKPRVFYTSSVFNISLLDRNPNNKIITMNSKENMHYYGDDTKVTDKVLLNAYFENEGKLDLKQYETACKISKLEIETDCICQLDTMLQKYQIQYVITKNSHNKTYRQELEKRFEIISAKQGVMILKYKK